MVDATTKRLIAGGFNLSARWKLDAAWRARLIGEVPKQPGVYAFAVNGKVHYVGSAQRGLAKRLRRYETTQTLRRRGLPVDPIAGLEEGLIREMQPKWNKRGLGAIRKKATSKSPR